jgi:hypothetical protein
MTTTRHVLRDLFATIFVLGLSGCAKLANTSPAPDSLTSEKPDTDPCNLIKGGNFEFIDNSIPNPSPSTPPNGQMLHQWQVFAPPCMAIGVFPNNYSVNNHLFYPTPDGNDFVYLSDNPHGNVAPYPCCYLVQDIAQALTPGKTYKLSFLQSAFAYPTLNNVAGSVTVVLRPTDCSLPALYTKTFVVGAGTTWKRWEKNITIPANSAGMYSIEFISDNPQDVAIIDDVSLCAK